MPHSGSGGGYHCAAIGSLPQHAEELAGAVGGGAPEVEAGPGAGGREGIQHVRPGAEAGGFLNAVGGVRFGTPGEIELAVRADAGEAKGEEAGHGQDVQDGGALGAANGAAVEGDAVGDAAAGSETEAAWLAGRAARALDEGEGIHGGAAVDGEGSVKVTARSIENVVAGIGSGPPIPDRPPDSKNGFATLDAGIFIAAIGSGGG